MVFAVGDHFDVDLVLQLPVGTISAHRSHVELSLPLSQTLQGKQLLLKRFDPWPGVGPQGTVGSSSLGVPIMDNRKQYPH